MRICRANKRELSLLKKEKDKLAKEKDGAEKKGGGKEGIKKGAVGVFVFFGLIKPSAFALWITSMTTFSFLYNSFIHENCTFCLYRFFLCEVPCFGVDQGKKKYRRQCVKLKGWSRHGGRWGLVSFVFLFVFFLFWFARLKKS